jgi:zinc-ribbon domain
MPNILETLGKLIGTNRRTRDATKRHSRTFFCRCGNNLFFRNSLCLGCQAPLGYLPGEARLVPLDPGPHSGTRVVETGGARQKFCGNRKTPVSKRGLRSLASGLRNRRPRRTTSGNWRRRNDESPDHQAAVGSCDLA